MIVRNILDDPGLVDRLDYFNDAEDTIAWLEAFDTAKSRALAEFLRSRFQAYKTAFKTRRDRDEQ